MRLLAKIGFALVILMAAVLSMSMRTEQASLTADQNETCPTVTSQGPLGITTTGVVVTYGPPSALLKIADYLPRRWRHFTGHSSEEESCRWFPQSPSRY